MAIFPAKLCVAIVVLFLAVVCANAVQTSKASDEEFGPVVRAYLGYLRNEQEAVASDEFRLLFERPPQPDALRVGEVLRNTFRFLGIVRAGEAFYVFARLDPYEQAELTEKASSTLKKPEAQDIQTGSPSVTRSRRVVP